MISNKNNQQSNAGISESNMARKHNRTNTISEESKVSKLKVSPFWGLLWLFNQICRKVLQLIMKRFIIWKNVLNMRYKIKAKVPFLGPIEHCCICRRYWKCILLCIQQVFTTGLWNVLSNHWHVLWAWWELKKWWSFSFSLVRTMLLMACGVTKSEWWFSSFSVNTFHVFIDWLFTRWTKSKLQFPLLWRILAFIPHLACSSASFLQASRLKQISFEPLISEEPPTTRTNKPF